MKKTFEIQHEFSELIPNAIGIPSKDKISEKLRIEHNRWKNMIRKNRCEEFTDLHYWEKVSVCTAL